MLPIFFILAIVTAILTLGGIAVSATLMPEFLFFMFLVLFFVSLAKGILSGDRA